jgi:hypothetical protein
MVEALEGGCLCGRVRYRVSAAPLDSGYCHCRMCQRSSGGPVQASAEFPVDAFEVTAGTLKAYRSSAHALRRFCPDCGSQITFEPAENPTFISVNLPTLDRPEAIEPRMHIWCESRIPWFEVDDELPRYKREGPPVGSDEASTDG